jgi:hypothetical protein
MGNANTESLSGPEIATSLGFSRSRFSLSASFLGFVAMLFSQSARPD